MQLERSVRPLPRPGAIIRDLDPTNVINAVVAFLFAASGPVAIVLAVGTRGGLGEAEMASWLFGSFFINGLLSIVFCLLYRGPYVFFWTIPGTVLVGPALTHLSFAEITGAFLATGLLMAVLGLSGLVRRGMEAIPMPIVMAMVAGVFLQFGIDLVLAFEDGFWIAAPMTAVFLGLSAHARLARLVPPLIAALATGIAAIVALDAFRLDAAAPLALALPVVQTPAFSIQAMLELVVPLAVTVIVVQNGQGYAVLTANGHRPPLNAVTVACGVTSLATAFVGTVSTCLTGPVNAVLSSTAHKEREYAAGVLVGVFGLAFGIAAPVMTRLMLAAPAAFIATLAGLAMLRVLQSAFTVSFGGRHTLGALVTFLVTVSDVAIFNIGAAVWGLVFGYLVTRLLEPDDFRTDAEPRAG